MAETSLKNFTPEEIALISLNDLHSEIDIAGHALNDAISQEITKLITPILGAINAAQTSDEVRRVLVTSRQDMEASDIMETLMQSIFAAYQLGRDSVQIRPQ